MTSPGHELRGEQLAPHSVEAEEAVLGAVLINPDAIFEVMGFLKSEDFFIVRHAWIWEAMLALHKRREPIDYLTVVAELEQMGRISEMGGAAYILGLVNKTPSALNAEGYAHIVERMALRRRLIEAAGQIARVSHSEETDIDAVMNSALNAVYEVIEGRSSSSIVRADVAMAHLYDALHLRSHGGGVSGLTTGLLKVDEILLVLPKGKPLVIAARPGMGKSAWLTQIAIHEAMQGRSTIIFSLEMSEEGLMKRIAAQMKRINTQRLLAPALDDKDWARLAQLLQGEEKEILSRIYIDETPGLTPRQMETRAQLHKMRDGVDNVMIDYIQLMQLGYGSDNRTQEMSAIMRGITYALKRLNMPGVLAAQLSRKCEDRADKRPLLSDLKESGQIEQDAEVVMFIYRDRYYNHETLAGRTAEINIAKNRNGPTGSVDTIFTEEYTLFENAAKIEIGE